MREQNPQGVLKWLSRLNFVFSY